MYFLLYGQHDQYNHYDPFLCKKCGRQTEAWLPRQDLLTVELIKSQGELVEQFVTNTTFRGDVCQGVTVSTTLFTCPKQLEKSTCLPNISRGGIHFKK